MRIELDQLAEKFTTVWEEQIQPLINTVIGLIGQISDLVKTLWEEVVKPVIDEFIDTSAPTLSEILLDVGNWVLELFGTVADAASGILEALGGVVDFFTGIFSQDWETATTPMQSKKETDLY